MSHTISDIVPESSAMSDNVILGDIFPSNMCIFIDQPSWWNSSCPNKRSMLADYNAAHTGGLTIAQEFARAFHSRTIVWVGASIVEQFFDETACALAGLGGRYSVQSSGGKKGTDVQRKCVRFHDLEVQLCYFVAEKWDTSASALTAMASLQNFVGINDVAVFSVDPAHLALEKAANYTSRLLASLSGAPGVPHLVWQGATHMGCNGDWAKSFNDVALPIVQSFGIPIVDTFNNTITLGDEWYYDQPYCMHRCQGGFILQNWNTQLLDIARNRSWLDETIPWKPLSLEVPQPPMTKIWGSLAVETSFVGTDHPAAKRILYPWWKPRDL